MSYWDQVLGAEFEKKNVLHSLKNVKCIQGYSTIGIWILKHARLAVKTVQPDFRVQFRKREKLFLNLLLNWCSRAEPGL